MVDKFDAMFEDKAVELMCKQGIDAYMEFDNDYRMHVEIYAGSHLLYVGVFSDVTKLFRFLDRIIKHGTTAIIAQIISERSE